MFTTLSVLAVELVMMLFLADGDIPEAATKKENWVLVGGTIAASWLYRRIGYIFKLGWDNGKRLTALIAALETWRKELIAMRTNVTNGALAVRKIGEVGRIQGDVILNALQALAKTGDIPTNAAIISKAVESITKMSEFADLSKCLTTAGMSLQRIVTAAESVIDPDAPVTQTKET